MDCEIHGDHGDSRGYGDQSVFIVFMASVVCIVLMLHLHSVVSAGELPEDVAATQQRGR